MSFSMETEKENKLSFLDVEIIREQGKFTTTIYRKPNFSGVYLKFCLGKRFLCQKNLKIILKIRDL